MPKRKSKPAAVGLQANTVPERIAAWIMVWLGESDREQARPSKRRATRKRAQTIADRRRVKA
jgi:hypothetical protein